MHRVTTVRPHRKSWTGVSSFVAALSVAVLVASCGSSATGGDSDDEAINWYVSIPVAGAQPVADAFTKETGIPVTVQRLGTFELWQRFQTENAAGRNVADVLSIASWDLLQQAKQDKLIAPFIPDPVELGDEYGSTYVDPDGYAFVTRVLVISISYNTKLVPEDKVPNEWDDLLDPYWRGKVAALDPREDAAGYDAYWQMANDPAIDMGFFERLRDQQPVLSGDSGAILNGLVSGEYHAAITFDHTTWEQVSKGAPLAVTYPTSGLGNSLDYNTLVAKAPHPDAAKRFLRYLSGSDAANTLSEALFVYSPRPDVTPLPEERPRLTDVNLLQRDPEAQAKDFDSFNDTFDSAMGR
ncbi:ABC transporter substrate-binding protein [Actinophytocola sp.]|uniref:ABC transporter substrate-binding protein n=1 Tax=Actinophytocola sp. TaxID=1872138 RepID=UPI003D6C1661